MKLFDMMTGPWAILPQVLSEIQSVYSAHLRGNKIDVAAVEARLGRPLANEQKTYQVLGDGVAVLNVDGAMSPKANLLMQVSGGVSTQHLTQQLRGMHADAGVRSALVVWDSPGGNVLGIPSAAAALRDLAASKPTVSLVENMMASAAAWVGTGANAVYMSGATDMAGSLGVISRISWEAADPNKLEFVRGKYKRASINGQAPSADFLAYQEAQLDYLYTLLIDAVAMHRGVSAKTVLDRMADGRVFVGAQAVDVGLVDGFATADELIEQLSSSPDRYRSKRGTRSVPVAAGQAIRQAAALPVNQRSRAEQAAEAEAFARQKGISFVDACQQLGITH